MKYKDFKEMSKDEMTQIVGGTQQVPPAANCKPSTQECSIVLLSGAFVKGKCTTIVGSGMKNDQCGCESSGYDTAPNSDCNQPVDPI